MSIELDASGARQAIGDLASYVTELEVGAVKLRQGLAEAQRERELALQEVGRLRARVEELEAVADDPVAYLLWSGRHQGWWAPDARGYTADLERAGRYTRAEAVRYVVTSAQCGVREQVTSMVAAPENWPVRNG